MMMTILIALELGEVQAVAHILAKKNKLNLINRNILLCFMIAKEIVVEEEIVFMTTKDTAEVGEMDFMMGKENIETGVRIIMMPGEFSVLGESAFMMQRVILCIQTDKINDRK